MHIVFCSQQFFPAHMLDIKDLQTRAEKFALASRPEVQLNILLQVGLKIGDSSIWFVSDDATRKRCKLDTDKNDSRQNRALRKLIYDDILRDCKKLACFKFGTGWNVTTFMQKVFHFHQALQQKLK